MSAAAYKVSQVPGAGVGLVASRDLLPGEFIIAFFTILCYHNILDHRIFNSLKLSFIRKSYLFRGADPLGQPEHLVSPDPMSSPVLAVLPNSPQPRLCLRPMRVPTLWTSLPRGGLAQVREMQPNQEDFHSVSGLNAKCLNKQTLRPRLTTSMWWTITMLPFFLCGP